MSGTNSPVESHNAIIKRNLTNRIKFHLKSAVEVFTTLIEYESLKPYAFHKTPKVPKPRSSVKTVIILKNFTYLLFYWALSS